MEIGLVRRSAPGVGLRRREDAFWPAIGRRPLEVEFIRRHPGHRAEGPPRSNSFDTRVTHTDTSVGYN